MNAPKRHHYVSQMQLSRFTNAEGKLYIFNKRAGRVLYDSPKNVFIQRHLYTFQTTEGRKDYRVEAAFSELESLLNPIIDKIIENARAGRPPPLTGSEKALWDLFFFMQWKRVPDLHGKVATEAEVEKQLDDIFRSLRAEAPGQIEQIDYLDTPDTRVRLAQEAKLRAIISPTGEVIDFLRGRRLAVLKVYSPGDKFVIGSLPIVRFGRSLYDEGAEAWLPVAPDIIVGFGASAGPAIFHMAINPEIVRRVNRAVAVQSTVFAGPSRQTIESLVEATTSSD